MPNPFTYCVAPPVGVIASVPAAVIGDPANEKALPPNVAATEVTVPPPAPELIVIVLPTVPKVILVPPTKVIAPTLALNEVTPAAPPPPAPI